MDETWRLPSTRRVALRARSCVGAGCRFISILPLASTEEERAAAARGRWLDRVCVCVCVCWRHTVCACLCAYKPFVLCTIVLEQSTITLFTMCHMY